MNQHLVPGAIVQTLEGRGTIVKAASGEFSGTFVVRLHDGRRVTGSINNLIPVLPR